MELKYKNPKTFVIGGDMGDIVYHLLFIKTLGGTTYHIDPSGGEEYSRDGIIEMKKGKFKLGSAIFMMPLIKAQSWLEDVDYYNGRASHSYKIYDVNASEYHKDDIGIRNLTHFHAKKYDLPLEVLNEPWLEVKESKPFMPERDIIVNRTLRYRGNDNYYYFNKKRIEERGIFVGLQEEYVDFIQRFGMRNLPWGKVTDALDMAERIKAHKKFIGNGSLACSMALGVGLDIEYEYCPWASHYLFQRDNIKIF